MKLQEYKDLNLKGGTIHSFHWKRFLQGNSRNEVKKDFIGRVEKETIANFRVGIDYSNMAINKDKITGSLPYGFFEYENEIIYSPLTNTYQVRVTSTMNEKAKPKVKYYLDGVEITKEELIDMNALGSKEKNPKPLDKSNPVRNITLDYIIEIK